MKKILLILFVVSTFNCFSQCIDCNSMVEALKKPEDVKTLKINSAIQGITLDSIPVAIGKLINLEILYLSDHPFTTIPKEIGNLTNLKELSFAGCKLKSLPAEIFQLKNLKELILVNNAFTEKYKQEISERFLQEMPDTSVMLD